MISILPIKGCLLIAEPSIFSDENFNQSVIFLTEHNKNGSIGFIINKPLEYTLHDLIPDLNCNFTIYFGGPVEQDNLYFIHNVPELIPDSLEIDNGLYWGGDFEIVKQLISNNKISKFNIRFFIGYSGWEANQLEEEVNENSWIVSNNNYSYHLLEQPSKKLWNKKMNDLGGEYLFFSNAPENPNLN